MRSENDSMPIRVILVEDDVTFQQALRQTFTTATDMQLVAVLSTRIEGLNILDHAPADVLLVDLGLPDGSGIDVIRAAHAKWPECNIMVSTAFGDEMHVMQSLEAGATGYLLKDSSTASIAAEIRSLHQGGRPISPLIARQILRRFRGQDAFIRFKGLLDGDAVHPVRGLSGHGSLLESVGRRGRAIRGAGLQSGPCAQPAARGNTRTQQQSRPKTPVPAKNSCACCTPTKVALAWQEPCI